MVVIKIDRQKLIKIAKELINNTETTTKEEEELVTYGFLRNLLTILDDPNISKEEFFIRAGYIVAKLKKREKKAIFIKSLKKKTKDLSVQEIYKLMEYILMLYKIKQNKLYEVTK
ncbi:MAG: hypothetical protein ACTSRZ_05730 [Promethearchaeota archaeon]